MGKARIFMGEKKNAYRILMGKPERKRPLVNSGHRLKVNVKWIREKDDGAVWSGFICLRIWKIGRLLWTQ
jgi:hypothetical protein